MDGVMEVFDALGRCNITYWKIMFAISFVYSLHTARGYISRYMEREDKVPVVTAMAHTAAKAQSSGAIETATANPDTPRTINHYHYYYHEARARTASRGTMTDAQPPPAPAPTIPLPSDASVSSSDFIRSPASSYRQAHSRSTST